MRPASKLSASLEDYIEAILCLTKERKVARARDIAKRLNVNRSSVTGALQSLSEKGLVNYAPYEAITLTPEGESVARDVLRRHEALRDFLVKVLSVDLDSADEAACMMEHAVPSDVMDRLVAFLDFVESCPRGGVTWINRLGYRCDLGDPEQCERCIETCVDTAKARIPGAADSDAGTVEPAARGESEA